ncbi:hypothetical protein ABID94_003653 [Streptomyces sp. PvR018]
MGIRLFVEVLEHAPDSLTWRERYVLSVLAENANDGTRECWPGIEDDPVIARRMRIPGRSSRYEVLRALREKKALETVSAGRRGHRAVYRIPTLGPALGPGTTDPNVSTGSGNSGHSVQEPRTLTAEKGPETTDPNSEKGSGNDVVRVRERPLQGPETTDPFPSVPSVPSASKQEGPVETFGIPEAARPLVDGVTAAGVTVRWPFRGNSWFPVLAMISKSGVNAMVEHAITAASRTRVESANYFLKGWGELPPLPPPGAQRPALRSVPATRSTTDERVAQGQALAAKFREEERRALEAGHHPQETA